MLRRLYFLLPDEKHTKTIVNELHRSGITERSIHILANDKYALKDLPKTNWVQGQDRAALIESILWYGNLWLFFIALALFGAALINGNFIIAAALSLLMLLSFFVGEQFVAKVPNTHLDNFTSAIQHGEILLMVDVPFYRVKEIVDSVHRHHPEAQLGGTCWSIDALGI